MSDTFDIEFESEETNASEFDKFSHLEGKKGGFLRGSVTFFISSALLMISTIIATFLMQIFSPALLSEEYFIYAILCLIGLPMPLFVIACKMKDVMVLPIVLAYIVMLLPMSILCIEIAERLEFV